VRGSYVSRTLKGKKPGAMSVELPTKFEMVINLRTARRIGLTLPPGVLANAGREREAEDLMAVAEIGWGLLRVL
jgi:ABC-type uncharacterized transport system substrate-binding protein